MAKKPTVFLSYRRASSRELARYVHARLTSLGFKVFIDVEELDGKRFASAIRQKIMESDYFLIILKPDTLDESSWVRRELEAALEDAKPIIPLTADGFEFSKHVPPELAGLKDYSGIPYYDHFADEGIERIAKILEPPVDKRNSPLPLLAVGGAAIAIVALLLVFGLPALSAANISTDTPTPTFTDTVTPSATPSVEPTDTSTATETTQPTDTVTIEPSYTPSHTASATDTPLPTQTATQVPSSTFTDVPTLTPTETATLTSTGTLTPSPTLTQVQPSVTSTSLANTPTSTASPTMTLESLPNQYPCDARIISTSTSALFVVYSRANTLQSPVGSLIPGDTVTIIDDIRSGGRKWYQVIYGDRQQSGWVWDIYVNPSESCP
jgi:hypothetical protein